MMPNRFGGSTVVTALAACSDADEGTVSAGANREAPADVGPLYSDAPEEPAVGSNGPERQGPPDTILRHGARGTVYVDSGGHPS